MLLCARGHVVIILQIPFLKQLSQCQLFKENPWNRMLVCVLTVLSNNKQIALNVAFEAKVRSGAWTPT
jgi:hypothetical protein